MWDLFISYASEDKDSFVLGLAEELKKYGVRIWFDEFELKFGDSLSASLNKGLCVSKFGLIVLSPKFFEKKWTEYELRSLITKDVETGKTILPI